MMNIHGSEVIEYLSTVESDFDLRLGEKRSVGVGCLQYLPGCLRPANNRLCGKTLAWEEGEVERRG